MGRLTPTTGTRDAICELSDGNPGALTIMCAIAVNYPVVGPIVVRLLDEVGLYGVEIYRAVEHEHAGDLEEFMRSVIKKAGTQYEDLLTNFIKGE